MRTSLMVLTVIVLTIISVFSHRDLYTMEVQTRSRSSSITIIEIEHPIDFKLVRNVLNGNTDPHVVKIIGKRLQKNKDGILYPNLPEIRSHLPGDSQSYEGTRQDNLVEYVIHELTDDNAKIHLDKQRERRQKYIIAVIGATTTLLSTATAALTAYFIEK